LLAAASLCIGALSWAFIERPFRRAKAVSQKTVFAAGATVTLAIAAVASVSIVRPSRLQNWAPEIDAMQFKRAIPVKALGLSRAAGWASGTYSTGQSGGVPDTILWGDSFAEALAPGFVDYDQKTGHDVIISALAGCPPLAGVTFHERGGGEVCTSRNTNILKHIGESKIRRVVLVARWSVFAKTVVRDAHGRCRASIGDAGPGSRHHRADTSPIIRGRARGCKTHRVGRTAALSTDVSRFHGGAATGLIAALTLGRYSESPGRLSPYDFVSRHDLPVSR
jgi:hypothetical protein